MNGRRRPNVTGSTPADDFVRIMVEIAQEEASRYAPRLGKVRGRDGKNVRVAAIEDDDDASPGRSRPRGGGANMDKDDLVLLFPLGDGDEVALGPIISETGGGREDLIGRNEIARDAINTEHISNNTIKGDHIIGDQIKSAHISSGQINKAHTSGWADNLADRSAVDGLRNRIADLGSQIDNIRDRIGKIDGGGGNRPQQRRQGNNQGPNRQGQV